MLSSYFPLHLHPRKFPIHPLPAFPNPGCRPVRLRPQYNHPRPPPQVLQFSGDSAASSPSRARAHRHPTIANASSGSPPSPPRPRPRPLPPPLLSLLPPPPPPHPVRVPVAVPVAGVLRLGVTRSPPRLQRHPLPAGLRLHALRRGVRRLHRRPPRRHALRAPRPHPAGHLHGQVRPRLLLQRQPLQRRHQLPHLALPLLPPPLPVPFPVAPLRLHRAAPPLRLLVRVQVRQLLPHHLRRHGLPGRHHRRQQQLHLHARRAAAVRRRDLPLAPAADGARRVLAPGRLRLHRLGGRRGRARRSQGAPRERDGVRRGVRLQDGAGGGGGGAGLRRGVVRGAREGGGVQGDGGRAVGEDERGAGGRRHGEDGHHRRPQRRHARRVHLQHGHRRRSGGRVHGARPDHLQHGGPRRAPGGGVPLHGRPHGARHRGAAGPPGHAVRARHAPPLHPVPRGRHRGLRLRQLRGRAPRHGPRGPAPAAAAGEGRERRRHGAGPHGPGAAHGDRAEPLLRQRQRRVHGALPPEARRPPRLPGPAVEGVLPDGVPRVHARGDRAAAGVDAVERGLRAPDALLRRVRQRRTRRRGEPEGGVEQPGARGTRRRVQRRQLHPGARVDTQSVVDALICRECTMYGERVQPCRTIGMVAVTLGIA